MFDDIVSGKLPVSFPWGSRWSTLNSAVRVALVMCTLFTAGVRCPLDYFKDPIDSWLPESLDACSCEKRNSCMGSGALVNSSDCVRAGSSDCVTAGSSDCVTAGSSDCVTAGSSDCNVNESSPGFTTRTAARWSFLQSLQIPVNSQTLNTTHAKFEKCTVIDTFSWISFRSNNVHLPPKRKWVLVRSKLLHSLMTTTHFYVFALRFEFPWFLSEIVLFVALFLAVANPLI